MTPFDRYLQAAQGYLELGLPLEANEEVEAIPAEMKTLSEVLSVRVGIFAALAKWDRMEAVARQLCQQRPDDPRGFLALASATRQTTGLQDALRILATVAPRFPNEAAILYNLACYAAQLGHLEPALAQLKEAIQLDATFREAALADPDLAALHAELQEGE